MDTSCLWRALARNVRWATAMVERSRGAELFVDDDLSWKWPESPSAVFLRGLFADHVARVRQIRLSGAGAAMLATLFEKLPPKSLQLRSLELECPPENRRPVFPTEVIGSEHLHILRVEGCDGPWHTLSLPALRHLKVYNTSTRPSLNGFLDMLEALPMLAILDLENSLPLANNECRKRMLLASLVHLGLSSTVNPQEVGDVLKRVTVPPSATLRLVAGVRPAVSAGRLCQILEGFVPALSSFFGRLGPDFSYGHLYLAPSGWCGFRLKAWRSDRAIFKTPDLELIIDAVITTSIINTQDLLHKVIPSLPLSKVASVTLEQFHARRLLNGALNCFLHLESVKVIGETTQDFILASLAWRSEYNDGAPALLPALRFLSIELYSFKGAEDCTVDDLRDCLTARSRQGARLARLTLIHCPRLLVEDVESLRQVVEVHWDGIHM